jgi:predicted MPP superfamily phosphohydrolase
MWQMHKEKARHVVLISDLHVGALLAPLPMSFDDEGYGFVFREWVRACFSEFCENFVPRITNGEPFVLVVNGDLIHGDWHRFGQLAIKSSVKQMRAA